MIRGWLDFLRCVFALSLILFMGVKPAYADGHDGALTITELKAKVYLIAGGGGNITVFNGEDGSFVIDDNYSQHAEEVLRLIESVNGNLPKYLVNTHFHGDHTGGNDFFAKQGTTIVAHENVRKRLQEGYEIKAFSMVVPPASEGALPTITFREGLDIHLNGDKVEVVHVSHAHTDTDSLIRFKKSNVVALGDIMFNGFFPFIDTTHGGSLKGVIRALETSLAYIGDDTIVIPGHGPVASRADVIKTKETLDTAYARLKALKNSGKSLEEAIAEKPLADIEKDWGGVIFSADQWISLVWVNI